VARLAESGRWAVEQAIEQVDRARTRGLDVSFDMHTRLFGMTNLTVALPPWALAGTSGEIIGRLKDPDTRQKMKSHTSIVTSLARGNWNRMKVQNCHRQPELAGPSIAEIARARGCDAFDVIFDILLGEEEDLHSVLILGFVYTPEDTHVAFDHPFCMVGSDATALSADRPLGSCLLHGAFTWAAWFWRHFVRETKKLTPEEAVRRLTSLPAERVGLRGRGRLEKGAWADIAIFDPAQFGERGTIENPAQPAAGMRHVFVNGELTLKDGVPTGLRAGRVLRKRSGA